MPARIPAIDRAKGVAIVGVLLIHARPLAGTWIHAHVIDHAVPVFLVLFGMTSRLWWERDRDASWRATTMRWYRARAVRLMVPVWSALVVLWTFRFAVGRNTESLLHVLLTFGGYMPWVGTGWFVTLALELVVLFPLLVWAVDRIGDVAALLIAAAVLVVCERHLYGVIALVRMLFRDASPHVDLSLYYYYWIFPPPRAFAVVAGMMLARRGTPSLRAGAISAAVVVAGGLIADRLMTDLIAQRLLSAFLDVPLTIAILVAVHYVDGALGSALAWLGQHSWGAYLGQLVVHEAVHALGSPDEAALGVRWAYFGVLLGSAVLLVVAGERIRRVASMRMELASRSRAELRPSR
jgi:peptidoglycan/LPS O-acetylase OafA/YrhL